MALTSNTLNVTSLIAQPKPEIFILDIKAWFPTISANLNLLPETINPPDDEILMKMILSSVVSRFAPAPQVLKAKCEHMFQGAPDDVRESIFISLLAMALTVIETFNHFQLWSESGNAMYEFDHFVNADTVALRKVNSLSHY